MLQECWGPSHFFRSSGDLGERFSRYVFLSIDGSVQRNGGNRGGAEIFATIHGGSGCLCHVLCIFPSAQLVLSVKQDKGVYD